MFDWRKSLVSQVAGSGENDSDESDIYALQERNRFMASFESTASRLIQNLAW